MNFCLFPKNKDKNMSKNISESLNRKYSQRRLGHAKQSVTDTLKTTLKLQSKKREATGHLIHTKLAHKTTKVSKLQNASGTDYK